MRAKMSCSPKVDGAPTPMIFNDHIIADLMLIMSVK